MSHYKKHSDKEERYYKREKKPKDKESRDKERGERERGDRERGDRERGDKERGDRERRDKEKKDKERKDKERRDRERKDKERRDKEKGDRERKYKEKMIQPENENHPEDDKEHFMFVYEDVDGILYNQIHKIVKRENVTIFPVYISGYNDNLNGEVVKFEGGKYITTLDEPETSWLKIVDSKDNNIKIHTYDEPDIVVYNGKFFHCNDDLTYYLVNYGAEYLPVTIV